jgi:SAM-dependent methyltransferase
VTLAAEAVKACCASAYSSAAARWLLGASFHPGGSELTSRLGRALQVGPRAIVIDVASGPGTSAVQLARETDCAVVGVELAQANVGAATTAAADAGLGERVRFIVGDAESLPVMNASVDGVLCECALCTFPDKEAAAREFARVLRPGGRLALSDVTADVSRLPPELTSLQAWVACIADARPLEEIASLLERAGLEVELVERHDAALAALLEQVDARLRTARLLGASLITDQINQGRRLIAAARQGVEQGALGYGVVIARRT